MPFLSMVRMALAETRRRTQRFSLSTQNRRDCRLGKKRRLVLLLACETLLPVRGPLPVTWHTRAMIIPLKKLVRCRYALQIYGRQAIRRGGLLYRRRGCLGLQAPTSHKSSRLRHANHE